MRPMRSEWDRAPSENWTRTSVLDSGFRSAARNDDEIVKDNAIASAPCRLASLNFVILGRSRSQAT
jgi:hypothetical protein